MVYYKFRAGKNIQVGYKNYTAGEEFPLSEADAKKWVSKSDFTRGGLIFVGEIAGEEPYLVDPKSKEHKDSKAKQDGAIAPLSFNLVALPVTFDNTDAGDKWQAIAPCDCVFEGFEINNKTPAQVAAENYSFGITVDPRSAWKEGTADGDLLERAGTYQPAQSVLFGAGNTYQDVTANAELLNPGTVPMGLTANAGNYCYVGFWDKFSGVAISNGVNNVVGVQCSVEYLQIDGDGNKQWVELTITDTTDDGGGNISFAQNGALSWEIPSDWVKDKITIGKKEYFYIRIFNKTNDDMTANTDMSSLYITTNKLTGYTAPQFINAGDQIKIYQEVAGVDAGIISGTIYLRRIN